MGLWIRSQDKESLVNCEVFGLLKNIKIDDDYTDAGKFNVIAWMPLAKPTKGESYCYVSIVNNIGEVTWNDDDLDNFYYSFNRIYKTKEECKRYIEIHKKFKENSHEPYWKNNVEKYYIGYNRITRGVNTFLTRNSKMEGVNYYFESRTIIDKLIDEFGEIDIKKYVLGVYD